MSVFDIKANEYDTWFVENQHLFASELDAVKSMLDKGREYVEVGVGTGLFASNLGIKKGVEPCKEMAKFAIERGVDVVDGVAERLPIDDSSIDGIVMITVDCFVKDIESVFRDAYRVLKDNGSYVMAFLDRGTPLGKCYEENKDNDIYYKDATFRSSSEMQAYLKDAGFVVEDMCQTVYTLDNQYQDIKKGNGEGVFALIKARKEIK